MPGTWLDYDSDGSPDLVLALSGGVSPFLDGDGASDGCEVTGYPSSSEASEDGNVSSELELEYWWLLLKVCPPTLAYV